jgi:hypothetical protein
MKTGRSPGCWSGARRWCGPRTANSYCAGLSVPRVPGCGRAAYIPSGRWCRTTHIGCRRARRRRSGNIDRAGRRGATAGSRSACIETLRAPPSGWAFSARARPAIDVPVHAAREAAAAWAPAVRVRVRGSRLDNRAGDISGRSSEASIVTRPAAPVRLKPDTTEARGPKQFESETPVVSGFSRTSQEPRKLGPYCETTGLNVFRNSPR